MDSKIVELAKRILGGQVPTVDDGCELAEAVIAMADVVDAAEKLNGPGHYRDLTAALDRLRRSAEGGK